MPKCCEGEWESTINGVKEPDNLNIHSEDPVSGNFKGHHGGPISGNCKGGTVTYEVTKGGKTYIYKGKVDAACENIDGNRKEKNQKEKATDDDGDEWVATKGGGPGDDDDDDEKDKKKDKSPGYQSSEQAS